jgi:hypothetical protein
MANYYATIRTNYFSVTDEEKFRRIIGSCSAEDDILIFDSEDGTGKVGFACMGSIYGIPPTEDEDDTESDLDAFYDALQAIIAEDDAIIITEVGYEKLRCLIGHCTVITWNEIQYIDVRNKAVELAGTLLNNKSFSTRMDY